MASSYALPTIASHGYSKSHSGIYLAPGSAQQSGHVRKAASNGALFTHNETSRENSPYASPIHELDRAEAFQTNIAAVQYNHWNHSHTHDHAQSHDHGLKHSHSNASMKSRTRGESDLGRPADQSSGAYRPSLDSIPAASTSWFSLPEALTAMLIPLPYILASAAYGPGSTAHVGDVAPPLSALDRLRDSVSTTGTPVSREALGHSPGVLEACTLASGSLILVGLLGKIRASERVLDRRKDAPPIPRRTGGLPSGLAQLVVRSAMSVSLPFYGAMKLGGARIGLILLAAIASDWTCVDGAQRQTLHEWSRTLNAKKATVSAVISCALIDLTTSQRVASHDVLLGYLTLAVAIAVLPSPLPSLASSAPMPKSGGRLLAVSSLIRGPGPTNVTVIAGLMMSVITIGLSLVLSRSPSISPPAIVLSTLAIAAMAAATIFVQPSAMRTQLKLPIALGCALVALAALMFPTSSWYMTILNTAVPLVVFAAISFDTSRANDTHAHDHAHNTHAHSHSHKAIPSGDYSIFTKLAIARCTPGGLMHGILLEKDSRRIAYFTCLNFGFMLVQGLYGYLSGSLGLLSDTVHMFFDCLGLVVGLGAAVASKWPTSPEMPYGWGKLNTLAGFGNGIFLMLVSVEFVWEAIEGMLEGTELRRVKELLVVSTLGFLVNMVGLFAFGHAHAGHDHGHGHGHDHGNAQAHQGHDHHDHSHNQRHDAHASHAHDHDHDHKHDHTHSNGHAHTPSCSHSPKPASLDAPPTPPKHAHAAHDRSHGHSHDHNDNMHGIFLHVAADAGGSLAVILSTALTLYSPWYLWDPLATILIALLIFAAAVPLVISSGQKLLLVVPEQQEYAVKGCLQAIAEERGVVGVGAPRFWVGEGEKGICGVVHVVAAGYGDLGEMGERVQALCAEKGVDCLVHVERAGEEGCWCGAGR
ncbi:putative zinc transporter msc2 [Oleoguttula sp. CCFEE 5521]